MTDERLTEAEARAIIDAQIEARLAPIREQERKKREAADAWMAEARAKKEQDERDHVALGNDQETVDLVCELFDSKTMSRIPPGPLHRIGRLLQGRELYEELILLAANLAQGTEWREQGAAEKFVATLDRLLVPPAG